MPITVQNKTTEKNTSRLTLVKVNLLPQDEVITLLDGLYEHSPWIVSRALASRPFTSLAHFKYVLTQVVDAALPDEQLVLIRAHPELAGKAMVSKTLTMESNDEQSKAGLTACSEDEFARIEQLNAEYNIKFGFPFIMAVRGARGVGLDRQTIIATFARRLNNHPYIERAEALRHIHRIAEIRLHDKFGIEPILGNKVWDGMEVLSQFTDADYAGTGQLTVTYLTPAHRACAQHIAAYMQDNGFDSVHIDAVGNVVGRYLSSVANAKTLLTGSHYDTVRNGGKYAGRLGIYVPMVWVRELSRTAKRLPFHLEVVAFAAEEGQRFNATFLGSSALVGDFDAQWLSQHDANGISLRQAMTDAGLDIAQIPALKRCPDDYLGFVEIHIEQGPVLNEKNLPLGIVTSINGSVRYVGKMIGMANHAETTPTDRRRDAAAAVAELVLYIERRAAQDSDSMGTVGMLQVPNGSINVVPGQCHFSLDLRAPNELQRDAFAADVLAELVQITQRRGMQYTLEETVRMSTVPSSLQWQTQWERAVAALGVPLLRMSSGAGHDAMKMHKIMPQAMLFVRGENNGVSHNPLESTTSDDMQLAVEAFAKLLENVAQELGVQENNQIGKS